MQFHEWNRVSVGCIARNSRMIEVADQLTQGCGARDTGASPANEVGRYEYLQQEFYLRVGIGPVMHPLNCTAKGCNICWNLGSLSGVGASIHFQLPVAGTMTGQEDKSRRQPAR